MKRLLLLPLSFAFALLAAQAGQLDIAVIEFPEIRDSNQIAAALSRVRLAEITDADRTRTREAALRGGSVLFAQSLPLTPGQSFSAATRMGNLRSDVSGKLAGSRLSVDIRLSEGVQAGLRNYQSRNYGGSALLGRGPTLVSKREKIFKAPRTVRGLSTVEKVERMTIVAAHFRP